MQKEKVPNSLANILPNGGEKWWFSSSHGIESVKNHKKINKSKLAEGLLTTMISKQSPNKAGYFLGKRGLREVGPVNFHDIWPCDLQMSDMSKNVTKW